MFLSSIYLLIIIMGRRLRAFSQADDMNQGKILLTAEKYV